MMPPEEADFLREAYREAKIILEYGSGGSTELAASLPGKLVLSVESDLAWSRDLRARIDESRPASSVIVHHVDIGETGPWGRPLDDRAWRRFHCYPNEIWDMPFFRQPDLVLIDGRMRTACLATVLLRTRRPVRVLFDDYTIRPLYREIEAVIRPTRLIGRMAEFMVEPGSVQPEQIGVLVAQFFRGSLHGMGEEGYAAPPADGASQA